MMGTGTGVETRRNTSLGISRRVKMGAGPGTGMGEKTGSRIEMRMKGRESSGTYEVVIEVSRKMREGGRGERVTSSRSRKTRHCIETVASC